MLFGIMLWKAGSMDENEQSRQGENEFRIKRPLIIGVGASAGSPDSLEGFFARHTADADQAIVLVLQHREALDENRLRGILGREAGAVLAVPGDGDSIEGGT